MDTMTTEHDLKPISQAEYIEAETGYLLRRLSEGNRDAAAVSARTLQRQLHTLLLDLDRDGEVCARIATKNGRYYRWSFLDE